MALTKIPFFDRIIYKMEPDLPLARDGRYRLQFDGIREADGTFVAMVRYLDRDVVVGYGQGNTVREAVQNAHDTAQFDLGLGKTAAWHAELLADAMGLRK